MALRWLFIIILGFNMLGCTRHALKNSVDLVPAPHAVTQHRPIESYRRVNIQGAMNVIIHTGAKKPRLILKGDPRDLAVVATQVKAGTLSVSLGKSYPLYGQVSVELYTHYLNGFEYHGRGMVVGKKLNTSAMTLVLDNAGRTTLQGQLGLQRLVIKGGGVVEISNVRSATTGLSLAISGKSRLIMGGIINITCIEADEDSFVKLYWVRSRALIIREKGKACVELAGIVNRLDVELWGNSRFFGRYLRAKRAFAKTHNQAVAEIAAIAHQHTLATDESDVRFYNLPTMRADFMAFNGAVLDMRDLSDPYLLENNDFNK